MQNYTIEINLIVCLKLAQSRDEVESTIAGTFSQGNNLAATQLFAKLHERIMDGSGRGIVSWSVKTAARQSDPELPGAILQLKAVQGEKL